MVNIRKATKEDVPKIKKIASMAWYDTYAKIMEAGTIAKFLEAAYNDERLERRIDDSLFLVAENDDEVIGFANFINGTELFLSAIYVNPAFQRKHVGADLLEAGLEYFNEYNELFVEVASNNVLARAFYDKTGFELVREYEEELFGEKVTTGLLKKDI
ncbi:N-acetyltransferase family protein [Macrococcus capreoli]|uniref:GNAT family N-acetyltransferase n=1 Tax=Macrococcus capreoli TaxID=2982690 RepID=UPI003F434693